MTNFDDVEYMDDFIKVVQRPQSGNLYHYTNATSLKSIFDNKEFWATRWDFLNDTTEFNNVYDSLRTVIELKIKDKKYTEILYDRIIEEINRLNSDPELRTGYYVLSFSLTKDSPFLWAAYSDFSGYCIEFNFDKLLTSIKQNKPTYWCGAVIYRNDLKLIKLNEVFEKCFENLNEKYNRTPNELIDLKSIDEEDLKGFIMFFSAACILYSMFFKQECFSSEDEFRFVFSSFHKVVEKAKKKAHDYMHFRERANLLLPYVKIPLDFKETIPVSSVLVGPKNNIDLAVKGIEYFFTKEDYDVPVEKSKIPLRY